MSPSSRRRARPDCGPRSHARPPASGPRAGGAPGPASSGGPTDAAARPAFAGHPELRALLALHPPRTFRRGETLIENTRHQDPPQAGSLAYVLEGLVRGAWNSPFIAPESHATTLVAGDGKWVGTDVFKYGANLFRYGALVETTAAVIPLADFRERAGREVVLDALRSVSLDWCAAASVLSLGNDTLERRALLLLYNLFRLHPRPEIEVRQRDVAELLGVTRQSLQPALKRLERSGLVSLGYGEIVVGEADALLAVLQARKPTPRG